MPQMDPNPCANTRRKNTLKDIIQVSMIYILQKIMINVKGVCVCLDGWVGGGWGAGGYIW